MDSDEGLSKAERELVVVATSGANHCTYCVVAHGAILRIRMKDPHIADKVATNSFSVELSERHRAIVDLALSVSMESASCATEADLEAARSAGLSEDEIWDIGSITALFGLSNRMVHLTPTPPYLEILHDGTFLACRSGPVAGVRGVLTACCSAHGGARSARRADSRRRSVGLQCVRVTDSARCPGVLPSFVSVDVACQQP